MTEVHTLICNWGNVVCLDGTVIDIDGDNEMLVEPDWNILQNLLVQAEKWLLCDDRFGPLDIEPVALLHKMLFEPWDNEDDRLREMIYRFQHMLRFTSAEDEKLEERIDKMIEPYRFA
jgi:hypothetical protein